MRLPVNPPRYVMRVRMRSAALRAAITVERIGRGLSPFLAMHEVPDVCCSQYREQEAEHYFELASSPKQIMWHEHCQHELSPEARRDRVLFLSQQLGLPGPAQHMLDVLEQIPPPVPIES